MNLRTKVVFIVYTVLAAFLPAFAAEKGSEQKAALETKAPAQNVYSNLILSEDGKTVTGTVDKGIATAEI
ncbi:MAG: hypothetical protein II103_01115, partial [Treponema sp.]|nr:hypothetical protein [Treponema sp.]